MLVVFGGLPGAGKTTISRALAQRVGATYLRIDLVEQAIFTVEEAVATVEGRIGHGDR